MLTERSRNSRQISRYGKVLIINADDYGISEEANAVVLGCYRSGRVTGVSIMPAGDCFSTAAEKLRDIGKREVGVHLALTGSLAPCSQDKAKISSLLDENGRFPRGYKSFATKYLLQGIRPIHIYREFRAQIVKILQEGLTITHLDSHEHIHMFPRVFKVAAKLMCEFNIPYMRIPREDWVVLKKAFSPRYAVRYMCLQAFAHNILRQKLMRGINHNDLFWGHFHSCRITDGILRFMAKHFRPGVNELAVHPLPPEMEAISGSLWEGELVSRKVRLVSHKEALSR